ncbi:acyltransferase family protein [Paenibacillus sp. S150]|uniref:acyltransferase family protein n=1 Tax=Paenibacillus sp. S150 TaxID=2749826 RepID=UPI001C585C49|nr:acyltransferase family protein [Paenibacillus sp. S150]MBW4081745.1 acyltransferase family protein [Paenibacillus sp. S150]
MNKRRELWIDAAKGFSIIFVVMGHSGDAAANHYLSWFRMPLFFMLSGLVFKPVDPDRYLGWAAKRTKGLMTPYAAYGILIASVLLLFTFNIKGFAENIARLLYGGLSLTGPYGVFWFITCLLFTQLLFGFIVRYSMRTQLLLIAAAYSLSHLISLTSLHNYNLPWNIDVSLLAVTYYAVGYYGKKAIPALISRRIALPLLLPLCAGVFALERTGLIHYSLNMKYKEYNALLLDLIIPLLISLTICAGVYWLSKVLPLQWLGNLGRNTIAIMYLHLPVNYALKYLLGTDYGLVPFTVIGVGVPLLAALWISRFPLLSRLYLGHNGGSRPAVSYSERAAVRNGVSAGD